MADVHAAASSPGTAVDAAFVLFCFLLAILPFLLLLVKMFFAITHVLALYFSSH